MKAALATFVISFTLYGCGSDVAYDQKACGEDIDRKAQASQMTVISKTFEAMTKTADGDQMLSGKVVISTGSGDQTMPFSCVMQGSGESVSVIRSDIEVF